MGPTQNNQNGPGGPKKRRGGGDRLKNHPKRGTQNGSHALAIPFVSYFRRGEVSWIVTLSPKLVKNTSPIFSGEGCVLDCDPDSKTGENPKSHIFEGMSGGGGGSGVDLILKNLFLIALGTLISWNQSINAHKKSQLSGGQRKCVQSSNLLSLEGEVRVRVYAAE